MQEIAGNAKTTAQINMNAGVAAQLQQVVKYAMEVGYETEDVAGYTRAEVIAKINQRAYELYQYPTIPTSYIDSIVDDLYSGESLIFHISGNYKGIDAGIVNTVTSQGFYAVKLKMLSYRSGTWSLANFSNTQFNVNVIEYYPTLDDFMRAGARKQVVAKDTATEQAISAGKNAILTADSALTEGDVIDTTKPVIINLYRTISYPAITAEDIEEKQRELVVTNIATDEVATTEKAELEDVRAEEYGDTEAYKLDLLGFFPFCIPRDIMLLLQAFSAEAETPEFDIPFPTWENGEMTTTGYHLSLAQFDNLAGALRAFQCVAFMIGLLAVTRQKYLRG